MYMTRSELLEDVDDFARRHDLTHASEMLRKGALVAQNPSKYEDVAELTDDERYHLAREVTHKWRHPRLLYVTIIICSIGAAVQYVSPPSNSPCPRRDAPTNRH